MRAAIGAILVLAMTATLAACGTVRVPPASGPRAHPGGSTPAPAIPAPPAGSRAEAAALAASLLSRLPLPAGARRLPPTPVPASVSEPASQYADGATSLDEHELFAVAQPLDALAAAAAARVPAGLSEDGTGYASGPGGVTMREVDYQPQSVPAGIYSAQLVLTMAPAGSGSLLRADAQVTWYPPRSSAEYIDPGRFHVLTITVTLFGQRVRTVRKVVTSQALIARLAEALDRSRAEPPVTFSCPLIFATYQLALSVSPDRPPVVVISATRWPCGGSRITVDGKPQPPLADDGAVVAVADQALGFTPQPAT
jgi:hypothetical protein